MLHFQLFADIEALLYSSSAVEHAKHNFDVCVVWQPKKRVEPSTAKQSSSNVFKRLSGMPINVRKCLTRFLSAVIFTAQRL